jgi:hypothetical protein
MTLLPRTFIITDTTTSIDQTRQLLYVNFISGFLKDGIHFYSSRISLSFGEKYPSSFTRLIFGVSITNAGKVSNRDS